MSASDLEIERKILIKMPDETLLLSQPNCRRAEVVQTYTVDKVRLRRWEESGRVTYIKTFKKHITDLTRVEIENEISHKEYESLIKKADDRLRSISKTRYIIPFGGKTLEIDIFPFWKSQAYLEIELSSEDEEYSIPDYIKVIKEVTEDKRYRNYALAQNIPKEENF